MTIKIWNYNLRLKVLDTDTGRSTRPAVQLGEPYQCCQDIELSGAFHMIQGRCRIPRLKLCYLQLQTEVYRHRQRRTLDLEENILQREDEYRGISTRQLGLILNVDHMRVW
ncbi:hypothetical protein J6590_028972 [Homalodisca vitripennis]|nr:hypothetical protein J6590_028972 [Homalodisca vitripennis]